MASRQYIFQPITGALPGANFEKQVVAFLTEIQLQLDEINLAIEQLRKGGQNDLAPIRAAIAALQSSMNTVRVDVSNAKSEAGAAKIEATAAKTTANEAKTLAEENKKGVLPVGGISLLKDGVAIPASWKEANGQSGTEDLSGYVGPGIKYVQRTA